MNLGFFLLYWRLYLFRLVYWHKHALLLLFEWLYYVAVGIGGLFLNTGENTLVLSQCICLRLAMSQKGEYPSKKMRRVGR